MDEALLSTCGKSVHGFTHNDPNVVSQKIKNKENPGVRPLTLMSAILRAIVHPPHMSLDTGQDPKID